MSSRPTIPRGRHAPPLEVRQDLQRRRLFDAAAKVFSRVGYAEASAEAIAREAGMSKATFYQHFDNKEEAMAALVQAAAEVVRTRFSDAAKDAAEDPLAQLRAAIRAFFDVLVEHPHETRTLLVEIVGAGPKAVERRDDVLASFARVIYETSERMADEHGTQRFASPHDAFAIVGAVAELASRQLRLGEPARLHELEPVVERLVLGLLGGVPAGR